MSNFDDSKPSTTTTTTAAAALDDATALLRNFNEKSDVAFETLQPLVQEYVTLLRALRAEIAAASHRAAGCLQRAKALAHRDGVDISKLQLHQHREQLDEEERSELK